MVIWDAETRGAARTCQPHSQSVTCLAWSRDGHHLVSGSLDSTVSLWRVLDNAQVPLPVVPIMRAWQSCPCMHLPPARAAVEGATTASCSCAHGGR